MPNSALAPQRMRVGRKDREFEVRDRLQQKIPLGALSVSGRDCRALQLLVKVAAHEGLEVRDPRGSIVRATARLVEAYGSDPDRKRLRLRWTVEVRHPTMTVPDRYRFVMQSAGPDGQGRVLVFTPGTELMLWDGDCV